MMRHRPAIANVMSDCHTVTVGERCADLARRRPAITNVISDCRAVTVGKWFAVLARRRPAIADVMLGNGLWFWRVVVIPRLPTLYWIVAP